MYLHTHTYDKFGTFVISFTSFFIFSFFFFLLTRVYTFDPTVEIVLFFISGKI